MSGFIEGLVYSTGYFSVFFGSIIGTATLFLPLPIDGLVFVMGGILNPWIVGTLAGIGMSIGELTGYYTGYLSTKIVEKRRKEFLKKTRELFSKYGFFSIPLFAFTPIPFDFIGILCGLIKYDVKKFFIGTLLGKISRALLLALAGSYASSIFYWFVKLMGWV